MKGLIGVGLILGAAFFLGAFLIGTFGSGPGTEDGRTVSGVEQSGQERDVVPPRSPPRDVYQALPDLNQSAANVKASKVPVGAAASVVYIDPVTGEFRPPPPGAPGLQLSPQLQNAVSTSSAGLVQVPSPVPGGGIMVRLNGRFQQTMHAEVDASGKFTMRCLPGESADTATPATTSKSAKE